ncbi:uncharacterized protein LOC141750418 [Larus michahellis]|uniref:uncharacterized protein LOC141750418 n=1 Tax=Larus michahellis TaxID=119627 RepID=UPI003D9AFD57
MAAPGPASLQRRLQSSQEARHRQAVLVRKLQAKVLQYRTRCRELEQQLEAGAGCLPGRWEGTEALEKALLQVKEEQQRCEDLAEANSLLREHLEKAKEVNSALKEDVGKLTVDWMRAREELEAKEREWRQERELYENYFRGDRDRLLGLWHQMVTFRRHFLEMKAATNRDLSELKAEQMRLSGSVMANCSRLNCSVMSFQAKGELEKKELQDRLKDLVALEDKHCLLQHELLVAREALEESHLERDVLKEEKHELRVALEKAEQSVAELTGAQNELSAELADLRVATANMSCINEALALDKVQLNKLVLQLEEENDALLCKVDEMERAKISAQEKLSLCRRTTKELCAEKAHLEQLLKKAEEQQEELRVELGVLAEEKEEAQEKLLEVSRQQESSRSGLEQLRQESSRQGHVLAEVCAEKELLVREKAALEVRLAAMERERQGLSEQLAEARSGKETVECSLLEAQQHLSELEITRSHLETQLHAVAQAKEVIQGEVKCLQWELEAERSLLKQEQQNMAQELLQKEEQHTDTLKVREADHQGEINKLLQDVQAIAEGQRLSWLSEKRLLSQRLERLQRAVARLDREKTELKQYSAELRRTLEEVERERRRLRRYCRGRALPDAGGFSVSESDQHEMLASQQTQLAQERK